MKLLDLPPEIFQRIIEKHVAANGLCKAWKQREVCKTFNIFITEEVFAHQPVQVYSKRRNYGLYREGLAIFLEYRLNGLHGAHELIPSVIRKAVDRLMEIIPSTSSHTRSYFNKKVIAAVSDNWYNAHVDTIKPCELTLTKCTRDTDDARLLCLVICMRRPNLIESVLRHCTTTWTKTYRMGYPLDMAVRLGDLRTVEMLLEDMAPPRATKAAIFSKAISSFPWWERGGLKTDIVEQFVRLHHRFLGRPRSIYCVSWVQRACRVGDMNLARTILDMGYTAKLAAEYRDCIFNNNMALSLPYCRRIMELFLERNVIDMTKRYEFTCRLECSCPTKKSESVLALAVRFGYKELVRFALETGAHPNGAVNSNGTWEFPLRRVIMSRNCTAETLKLPLSRGATFSAKCELLSKHDLDSIEIVPEKRELLEAEIERRSKT